jgi:hypothetical protein
LETGSSPSPQDFRKLSGGFNPAVRTMRSSASYSIPPGINSLLNLPKPVRNRLFSQSAGLPQAERGFQPCGKNDAQQRILLHPARNKFPAQFAQAGWKPALLQSAGLPQAERGFQPRGKNDAQQRILLHPARNKFPAQLKKSRLETGSSPSPQDFRKLSGGFNPAVRTMRISASYEESREFIPY